MSKSDKLAEPVAAAAMAQPIAAAPGDALTGEASVRDYWALMKPRVMSLVVFTAFVGMMAAPATPHPVIALASLLCVAMGAGASGALNMWWDADIDCMMERTRKRPIPLGRVAREEALALGVGMSILSVALLTLFANPEAGALLAFTIAFYLFVYTMWLKRRTAQNIVIGGAAGAFPPMIGWSVAAGHVELESLLLFAIIFLWTPPHSWALALFRNVDYRAVGVPMLPVAAGDRETRRQIKLYAALLAPFALAPVLTEMAGPVYGVVAAAMTARFLQLAWRLGRRDEAAAEADKYRDEKRFFGFSIVYLFTLFLALLLEAMLAHAL